MNLGGFIINLPFNIQPWNIYEIFLMDAITYMLVILIFIQIRYNRIAKEDKDYGNLFNRLKQGIAYLKKHPLIFKFGFMSHILFAFLLVEIHILLPTYVHNFLKANGDIYDIPYCIASICRCRRNRIDCGGGGVHAKLHLRCT